MTAVGVGVLSGVIASIIFLATLRWLFSAHSDFAADGPQFQPTRREVLRFKIVNRRRWSQAVKLRFELVALTPITAPAHQIDGWKRFLVAGERRKIEIRPHKLERTPIEIRPSSFIALPRFRKRDHEANYALRITTSACPAVLTALTHPNRLVRVLVYAEHTRGP